MWKLLVGALLVAAGIYGIVSTRGILMGVSVIMVVVGVYMAYSWYSTPTYMVPPPMTTFGGRRRGGRR